MGDTTEFVIGESGKLYLAAILDLCSRFVVGWALSAVNDRHLTLRALEMAIKRRCPDSGLLHHSDQGCTYASEDYQDALEARGIVCSMSRRGNCYDNAVMESFFSSLKFELGEHFDSHGTAKMELFDYIEVFYNQRRRHSTLGQVSPAEYERRLIAAPVDAAGAVDAQTRPPLLGKPGRPGFPQRPQSSSSPVSSHHRMEGNWRSQPVNGIGSGPDGGRCVVCGATDELHFDHDLPWAKGGTSLVAGNVQLLCARHNISKRDRIQ